MRNDFERARLFFDDKDYAGAARLLRPLVEEAPDDLAVRMLLARAYYHSAQLSRAETELRAVLDRDPVESYAHLLLGRTLERQSRPEDARRHLRLWDAMTRDDGAA